MEIKTKFNVGDTVYVSDRSGRGWKQIVDKIEVRITADGVFIDYITLYNNSPYPFPEQEVFAIREEAEEYS